MSSLCTLANLLKIHFNHFLFYYLIYILCSMSVLANIRVVVLKYVIYDDDISEASAVRAARLPLHGARGPRHLPAGARRASPQGWPLPTPRLILPRPACASLRPRAASASGSPPRRLLAAMQRLGIAVRGVYWRLLTLFF